MKIINAWSMGEIKANKLEILLVDEYVKLWIAKYESSPKGMHPIPSNVAQDEVHFYIDFD